jgi:hypothetical protein
MNDRRSSHENHGFATAIVLILFGILLVPGAFICLCTLASHATMGIAPASLLVEEGPGVNQIWGNLAVAGCTFLVMFIAGLACLSSGIRRLPNRGSKAVVETEAERRQKSAIALARKALDPDNGIRSPAAYLASLGYSDEEIHAALARANEEYRLQWGGAGARLERVLSEQRAEQCRLFGEREPKPGSDSEPYGPGDW